jgi:hypothetical protein
VAGLLTGRDFIRTAWTKVKMAVFAPMPSEMVRTTVAANPGDFWNWRKANFKSFIASMDGQEVERKAEVHVGTAAIGCPRF